MRSRPLARYKLDRDCIELQKIQAVVNKKTKTKQSAFQFERFTTASFEGADHRNVSTYAAHAHSARPRRRCDGRRGD